MTAAAPGDAKRTGRIIWISTVVVVGLATVASGAWAWWSTRDRELSVKPPRSATSEPLPASSSTVQLRATLPVSVITEALGKAVPATFPIAGRQKVCAQLTEQIKKTIEKKIGGDVGKFVGAVAKLVTEVVTLNQTREVCQDVDYHVNINRDGPVQVTSASDHIHISVPISASGQAGFTGEVAKALALDKKNFRGALIAFADIRLDLNRDWCPQLSATADFNWTNKAEFEIVHNWWINIDGQIGPRLKDMISDALRDLKKTLTCDDIKKAVRPSWHPYLFPITLPTSSEPVAFVNVVPLKIGFSGIEYQTAALRLAMSIEARTEVTTAPPEMSKGFDLPPLERISNTANHIDVTVPIRVGYDMAVAQWSALVKGKTFSASTSAGEVKVMVSTLELYPSAGQLAFAMHVAAKVPGRIFDTSGQVYLAADPFLDAPNQRLRMKNVRVTRQLDNELWSILSAVFDTQIRQIIEEKAVYDLKPDIAKLQQAMNQQLAKLNETQNIDINLQTGFVGLRKINVADEALEVAVGLTGTADITINSLVVPK